MVREVIEKDRAIASVAASYDLVAQTVGNWVTRYRKEHATDPLGVTGPSHRRPSGGRSWLVMVKDVFEDS